MKFSKTNLKQIIKEELDKVLNEEESFWEDTKDSGYMRRDDIAGIVVRVFPIDPAQSERTFDDDVEVIWRMQLRKDEQLEDQDDYDKKEDAFEDGELAYRGAGGRWQDLDESLYQLISGVLDAHEEVCLNNVEEKHKVAMALEDGIYRRRRKEMIKRNREYNTQR